MANADFSVPTDGGRETAGRADSVPPLSFSFTVTREGVTTVCQTLTTAILSLLAARLSVGSFFFLFFFFFFFSSPVDALPLIQLLLVLQALNSKLGCSQKKKGKKASYTFTDKVIYRGVAVEGNGHRSCLPPPRTAWCRDPPKTHILHGSGCAY